MSVALLLPLLLVRTGPGYNSFTVDGVKREAIVSASGKVDGKRPVIFVFHGHGGNMQFTQRGYKIDNLWPEAIVVYPQGLPTPGMTDPEGKKNGWQQRPGEQGDRDLKFVDAMLARLHKEYKVDDHRIYAMGHSNGGRFSYVLWAKRGNIFAAYAPSGSPSLGLINSFNRRSAFVVAGEKDPIVPFAGQQLSIQRLRRFLGTDTTHAKVDGFARYETAKDGTELGTYIFPGGHQYPPEAIKLAITFLKRHSL